MNISDVPQKGIEIDMPRNSDSLTESEILVMVAIRRMMPEAYGVSIQAEIARETGRVLKFGVLYTILSRLQQNGLLSSRDGEATPERGGRAKKYFAITGKGQRALDSSIRELDRVRNFALAPSVAGGTA